MFEDLFFIGFILERDEILHLIPKISGRLFPIIDFMINFEEEPEDILEDFTLFVEDVINAGYRLKQSINPNQFKNFIEKELNMEGI